MSRHTAVTRQDYLIKEVPVDFNILTLHRANPSRYPFLLQSTAAGGPLGAFDILFAFPQSSLTLDGSGALHGSVDGAGGSFLDALNNWWKKERVDSQTAQVPFRGGWFLYLGYELASEVEPTLDLKRDTVLPTAFAVRCPAAFVYQHETKSHFIVCEPTYAANVDAMLADAERAADQPTIQLPRCAAKSVEEDPEYFLRAVRRAKEHVAAGDIYQANLSRTWRSTLSEPVFAADVYQRLCEANPAPFAGLVQWQDTTIISSSPERLISVQDGKVSTRPIAGTRPRGANVSSDSALSEELFGHPKERAEHVMLIDLERSDLGRVCRAGSVTVDEFMVLESYAHVHHIVSNVKGVLRDEVLPGEAIRAVFPGGTITGCPKVRCMEIIGELEQDARGAYTGSFGYLNRDGSLDLNILIRTMVMRGNKIELRAGSGIVAESDPEAELAETRAKAKGLLMALA